LVGFQDVHVLKFLDIIFVNLWWGRRRWLSRQIKPLIEGHAGLTTVRKSHGAHMTEISDNTSDTATVMAWDAI
jgi:hypothetical protein